MLDFSCHPLKLALVMLTDIDGIAGIGEREWAQICSHVMMSTATM